ncbi:MAG: hypothetical protein ABI855_19725, partial [Bacteroidota bacterium]
IDIIFLSGENLSSDAIVKSFQKTYGSKKVEKPFDNFFELISLGIALTAKQKIQHEPIHVPTPQNPTTQTALPAFTDTNTQKSVSPQKPIPTIEVPPVITPPITKVPPEPIGESKKPGRKKSIIILLVILFAAAGGYFYYANNSQKEYFVNTYVGQLKGKQIRFSLVKRRYVLTGSYIDPATGKTSRFKGNIDSKGNFSLLDDSKPINAFYGKLNQKFISGQWSTYGNPQSHSFYFTLAGGY